MLLKQKNKKVMILTIVTVITLIIVALIFAKKITIPQQPVFSTQNMLDSLWYYYKKENLEEGTLRALDKQQNNITTSEGQSYTMLRAVWIDDKDTFDKSWEWTKNNLQHDDDHLFSWLFGQRLDGSYGVLIDKNGDTSASDADVDIALALLFASKRWGDQVYYGDAIEIIRDIWEKEVVIINGKPYLAANDKEKFNTTNPDIIVNPSYFAPYAYRIFAKVDPQNDWIGLVDSGYLLIEDNISLKLDTETSAGIPSDWLKINKKTGKVTAISNTTLKTNYSYDALRLPWRLALDIQWFNEQRAIKVFESMKFFSEEWESRKRIYTNYDHSGNVVEWNETSAMYGGIVGYFMFTNKEQAEELYYKKLESLYNVETFNWHERLSYYDMNWAWFGLALYNNKLQQLYPLE